MWWLIAALLSPFFYSLSNICDNVLSTKVFRDPLTFLFFGSALNLISFPVVFLIDPPVFSLAFLPLLAVLGLAEIGYLIPYLLALREADTSVVISLFSLGKVIIPFVAFLFVGEMLSSWQYLAFLLIIVASTALTFDVRRLRFNRALALMAISSLLYAIQIVSYKYALSMMSWGTAISGWAIFSFLFGCLLIFKKRARIVASLSLFRTYIPLFVANEGLTISAEGASAFALSLAPVTIVAGIGSFQPFLLVLYAVVLGKRVPHLFREHIERRAIIWKIGLYVLMGIGIVLLAR